jgi:hypothetical protein
MDVTNGYDSERGEGWVLFAGIMILLVSILNIFWGISAIANAHVVINGNHFIIDHRNAWGWAILIIGVLQLYAAFSIWSGGAYGRWVGVITASLNGLAVLADMQAYPYWSLAIFTIDILIIYGLVVYGGQRRTAIT